MLKLSGTPTWQSYPATRHLKLIWNTVMLTGEVAAKEKPSRGMKDAWSGRAEGRV